MKKQKFSRKSDNYDFNMQHEPLVPMGNGNFANMPDNALIMPYGMSNDYRDGILNDDDEGVEKVSKIEENRKYPKKGR